MRPVSVVLAGACGYGGFYLAPLLREADVLGTELVAVADPKVEQSEHYPALRQKGIPTFQSLEGFYETGERAELAIIAAPIHCHLPLSQLAADHGACVLCEKPLAATAGQADAFLELEHRCPGFVAIGYQWSFAPATQALKQDIIAGRLGRPRRLKTMVLWPRTKSYYERNNWAGKLRMPNGAPVHDSPANNANAHHLHNMLYVLGDTRQTSALPARVESRLYRAKPIENFDSAAVHVTTASGVDVWFYATHAVRDSVGPVYTFEFDDATVSFCHGDGIIRASFTDGTTVEYGDPELGGRRKIIDCVRAVRTGAGICCGVTAAAAQTRVIHAVQNGADIMAVPDALVRTTELPGDDILVWADGLAEAFSDAYHNWALPAYP